MRGEIGDLSGCSVREPTNEISFIVGAFFERPRANTVRPYGLRFFACAHKPTDKSKFEAKRDAEASLLIIL